MNLLVNYTPEQMDWSFPVEDAAPTETDLPHWDLLEAEEEPVTVRPAQEESYIGVLPKETDAAERDLLVTRHVELARAVTSVEKILRELRLGRRVGPRRRRSPSAAAWARSRSCATRSAT